MDNRIQEKGIKEERGLNFSSFIVKNVLVLGEPIGRSLQEVEEDEENTKSSVLSDQNADLFFTPAKVVQGPLPPPPPPPPVMSIKVE